MASWWRDVAWARYRYVFYLIPQLGSIPVAILLIKSNVAPTQQLNVAAVYMALFTLAIVLSVPVNYMRGLSKRYWKLIDFPHEVDVPQDGARDPKVIPHTPLQVMGMVIPRTEILIPSGKDVNVSGPLPSVGKARVFSLMLHGVEANRIKHKDGIVYFEGTPINSTNAEGVLGYFVDPDVAVGDEEFGPSVRFEVVLFLHGDRPLYTDPALMDAFWATVYSTRPELEKQALEALRRGE